MHRSARTLALLYAAAARLTTKSEHISSEKITLWFQKLHSGGSELPVTASLGHVDIISWRPR